MKHLISILFSLNCAYAVSNLDIVDWRITSKLVSSEFSINFNMKAPSGYSSGDDVFFEIELPSQGFSINEDNFKCSFWRGFKDSDEVGCNYLDGKIKLTRPVDESNTGLAFGIDGLINP